jgi:hypothetical protein
MLRALDVRKSNDAEKKTLVFRNFNAAWLVQKMPENCQSNESREFCIGYSVFEGRRQRVQGLDAKSN